MPQRRNVQCTFCRQTFTTAVADECAHCFARGGLVEMGDSATPEQALTSAGESAPGRPPLSVWDIVRKDWPSGMSMIMLGVMLVAAVFTVAFAVWNTPDPTDRIAYAIIGSGIFGSVILTIAVFVGRRIRQIHYTFAHGDVVSGRVIYTGSNSENVGYATVAYTYNGQEYEITQVLGPALGEVSIEDPKVEVIVDPARPEVGYVVGMYLDLEV